MIETASREHIDPDSLASADRIDFLRSCASTGVHILALGALFTGVSAPALIALLGAPFWHHRRLSRRYEGYDESLVRDLRRFPELRFLDRLHMLAPLSLGIVLFGVGWWLEAAFPGLGATPWQMLGWGLFVSTVLLYYVTCLVNSVTHMWGRRRYATKAIRVTTGG